MKHTDWVIDITNYSDNEFFCFIPVENIDTDSPTFVTGLSILSTLKGFSRGNIRGVIHQKGQEICDKWIDEHKGLYTEIMDEAGAV